MKPIILLYSIFIGLSIPILQNLFAEVQTQYLIVNRYECEILEIIDGDTFKVEIIVPEFDVKILNQIIRAANYDAFETSKRRQSVKVTDEEIIKGKECKEFISTLLKNNKLYIIPRGHDVYGRRLGRLFLSNDNQGFIDLADIMKEAGFLR